MVLIYLSFLLLSSFRHTAAAIQCPEREHLSCSAEADRSNPCCVPTPGGLLLFKQRFEPDVGGDEGSWGIDGMEVLDCNSQDNAHLKSYNPTFTHEEIISFCLNSKVFGGEEGYERAEVEWAQSEVGEGVEETWERSWNVAGRFVSTLGDHCESDDSVSAQSVPAFFHALHQLHQGLPTASFLSDSDITPSFDVTYSLAEIELALRFRDHQPVAMCDNMTLSTVLWPLQVTGRFLSGRFSASGLFKGTSNCPSEGIIYPQANTRSTPTPKHTWDPIRRPTPRPITLGHDESRLWQPPEAGVPPTDPQKLAVFKTGDEGREERKDNRVRKFLRDEL